MYSGCMNDCEDAKDVQAQCTDMVLHQLCDITGEKNIQMNYVNYETDIVTCHHVKIDGWPIDDGLQMGIYESKADRSTCKGAECCEAAGEIIRKKRQGRSDAGTTKPKGTAGKK
ncbi:hypothetical protein EDD18DRAFT_1114817 [Armillaria luteobubalina]|uniref:Uncharacterized protein n=1 Tax=Armillaria luteobubalina TaxID=153913 RepID=A0AA39UFW4_9AGAR|nr:hypothetical protein EDD18DRAFT_1114817 [Armillaria luteobubalina]